MIVDMALIIAAAPKLRQWQLPPVRTGKSILLGWRVPTGHYEDNTVPGPVANTIARALTRVALVTLPTSTPPKTLPSDSVRVLEAPGAIQRVKDWTTRTPRKIYLVSTRNPESALMLFEDGGFPWSMQGIVALLSAPDGKPPQVDRSRLLAILNLDAVDAQVNGSRDLWGAIVPGVDGVVLGLITRDETIQASLTTALEEEARSAGLEWIVTTEDEFGAHLRPG